MKPGLILLCVLAMAGWCRGDIVTLTDGSTVEGTLQKSGDNWTVTKPDGAIVTIKSEDVRSIEVQRATPKNTAANAQADLRSLRNIVENSSDLKEIVQRYQKFIDNPANASVRDDAAKDLAAWQDRLDHGLVKLGSHWITPQERATIRHSADQDTLQARDLLAHGQLHTAEPLLTGALQKDPNNASALYLDGLRLAQQEQPTEARKRFAAIIALLPDNAPSLNNLAVLTWRQKSYASAAALYGRAMIAAPQAKDILNNLAEFFAALPEKEKDNAIIKRTSELFVTQDTLLQQAMNQAGWFRWGATWVTAKQLDELKAAQEKIQTKLDTLRDQFDRIRSRISANEAEIQANQATMDALAAGTLVIQPNGLVVQLPLSPAYTQLQARNAQLAGNDKDLYRQLDDVRAQGKEARGQLPVPQYTGVQNLIGVEGMPPVDRPAAPPAPAPPTPVPGPASSPSPLPQ